MLSVIIEYAGILDVGRVAEGKVEVRMQLVPHELAELKMHEDLAHAPQDPVCSYMLCMVHDRAVNESVQEVVEILQPGPLQGRAGRWQFTTRQEAQASVDRAVSNWKALQEQLCSPQPLDDNSSNDGSSQQGAQ